MTTLQEKIDADFVTVLFDKQEWIKKQYVDKAIQELIEQIEDYRTQCLRFKNNQETKAMADAYENVLALIGEAKKQ